MRAWLAPWLLLACAPVAAPPPAPAAAPTSAAPDAPRTIPSLEARLRSHLEALVALRGRGAASPDEEAAARYVAGQLDAMGVVAPARGRMDPFASRDGPSRNVYGWLAGARDDCVIVGAHIDHLGMRDGVEYPGAEDNASGVAAVLEIGRALVGEDLDRPVLLAFFGAEEIGLGGSRHLASSPVAPVAVMVNVDMIGRKVVDSPGLSLLKPLVGLDDDDAVGMIGTEGRPWLRALVDDALDGEGLTGWAPEDLAAPLERIANAMAKNRADDASFAAKGIPTVFFSSGESADYHQPTDTVDRLLLPLMARRTRAIAALVAALSRAEIPPPASASGASLP